MKYVIALDHGNGWVKARTENNEITLPSFFARKSELGESYFMDTLDVKEYESSASKGNVYLWGGDISSLDNVSLSYGSQDRYKQEPYRLLSEFALAETVLPDGYTFQDVVLVTGVPSVEKGKQPEKDLIEALQGGHLIKVEGEDVIIRVDNVKVLPQPIGTIMSLYLDETGFVADESYEEDSVAVIDIGTGTTDIDHVKALKRKVEDSDSITQGMFDVYRKVADWVNSQNTSARATVEKVEKQFASDKYVVSKRISYDISDIKERALTEVADKIKSEIILRWKTWDHFDKILITGGGASQLGKRLQKLIGDAEIVKNAQTANVQGFYNYGKFLVGGDE